MNRASFRSLIRIPRETVRWKKFSAAAGRGGQHVNRVDTAVEVRFRVDETWISPPDRILLKRDFAHLITKKDEIVLIESKHREPLRQFQPFLLASATSLQKTGSETGFLAQNLDRLPDRDFQGRISDRKAEQVFKETGFSGDRILDRT